MEYFETKELSERAILAGVHTGCIDPLDDSSEETLAELARLADTAGAEVVGTMLQNRPSVDSAQYMGEGKLEELKNACEGLDANLVIFDDELSPIQLRNIERVLGVRVIDRSMLILDIFARHAVTREGKIQVELAQLRYLLPRLAGMGSQMSRLGAGIGTRGPGETKLETDRRHIRRRIGHLQEDLKEIKNHRELLRRRREKDETLVCALVGYTNAGKSSLLNALTGADVLAEDKLFATLDPTMRALELSDGRLPMIVDTVGFIRKLPHHLIEAFKSTLEEAVFADLLLIVLDSSSDELDQHIEVVSSLLKDIGAGTKPRLYVYNKIDQKPEGLVLSRHLPDADAVLEVSAHTGEGLDKLVETLAELLPGKKQKVHALIPYDKGNILSLLHRDQTVLSEEYEAEGTAVEAFVDAQGYALLREFLTERE